MNPTLIRLPNGDYVNPAHVVSVKFMNWATEDGGPHTIIFVIGPNGGNGVALPGDQRDEVARLINNTPQ